MGHHTRVRLLRALLGRRYERIRAIVREWERVRVARLLAASPIFDDAYYRAQTATEGSREQLAAALVAGGFRVIVSPHPLVDVDQLPQPVRAAWLAGDMRPLIEHAASPDSLTHQWSLAFDPRRLDSTAVSVAWWLNRVRPVDSVPAPAGWDGPMLTWSVARETAIALASERTRQSALRSLPLVSEREKVEDPAWIRSVAEAPMPSNPPTVSIVMAVRSRERVVSDAIRSVLAQTYPAWELLVVDDGSSDATPHVVEGFAAQDPRIRLLRQPPTGVSAARNRGCAAASGEYIAFLDSDNTWSPAFLQLAVGGLRRMKAKAGFSSNALAGADHTRLYRGGAVDRESLLVENSIDLNCLVVERELVAAVSGFDERLRRWVDHDFVLRLTARAPIAHLPFIGVDYDDTTDAADRITRTQSHHWQFRALANSVCDFASARATMGARAPGSLSAVVVIESLEHDAQAVVDHIDALIRTSGDGLDLVLVDNASAPRIGGQIAMRYAAHPRVRYRRLARDYKAAIPRNVGLIAAAGERVLFVERAVSGDPGWIRELSDALDADESIACVQPLIVDERGAVASAGMHVLARHTVPTPFLVGHPVADALHHGGRGIEILSGEAVLWRAADLIDIDGFDALFVDSLWQADASVRARRASRAPRVHPALRVMRRTREAPAAGPSSVEDEGLFLERWGGVLAVDGVEDYARIGLQVAHLSLPEPDRPAQVMPVVVRAAASADRLRWRLRVPPDDPDDGAVERLAAALTARGGDAFVDRGPDGPRAYLDDAVVSVRTSHRVRPVTGRINVLWLRSDDAVVEAAEILEFDAVWVPEHPRSDGRSTPVPAEAAVRSGTPTAEQLIELAAAGRIGLFDAR